MASPGRCALALILAMLPLLLAGCGREDSPEQRVRALIGQVAASAEARAWGDFDAYLADDFSEAQGLTRKEVLGMLTRYILAHRSIHVLQRVREIEASDPRHAHAVVLAALTGSPVAGPNDLVRLKANLYRFEIELADDGDGFKVTRGAWQPVGVEALIFGQ